MQLAMTRRAMAGLALVGMMGLAACAPIPVLSDNPKPGTAVAIKTEQPLRVRWTNLEPANGKWVLEQPPGAALKVVGTETQPAAAGAQQLEMFDFVGAAKGTETLTFVYETKEGGAAAAEGRVSIVVNVG